MNKVEEIKNQIVELNEQVGWDNLNPENSKALASLLIGEAQELWEEINNENRIGLNKYDVALEAADVYIYLQKICIALDIDLFDAVEDKMLINRARFLNDDYREKVISPKPRAERYYKVANLYRQIKVEGAPSILCGQIAGIKNEKDKTQKVYILNESKIKANYMKKIIGIINPQNDIAPIWIASDTELSADEIADALGKLDYHYDLELIK